MIENLDSLFYRLIELPIDQHDEFLDQECANDTELKAQLINLLQSHEQNQQESFILDRPVVSPSKLNSANVADTDCFAGGNAKIYEKAGDQIGRYRLLEKVGEGGMGVVYMAEQVEDVHRRVALKIIKLGMDTRQVIARFEAERQAMAMFDHQNIARILDAGATSSGRPFFVMELVRGSNIIDFVKERNLNIDERLRLFKQVCHAVQHAHQKGIIHRDLKPSNILVTLFDGVPVPKVIDFGIAKALNQRLTEKTLFTRYSAMVGTPQYMSPEQAEMSGLDIDTRADIFSLGVLLYELLTGTTPLNPKSLDELHPVALIETLQNQEVETPSTRMSRVLSGECEVGSDVAATEWSSRLKGELDWIVMKAVSRDRTHRYPSATEFAADIERFLSGEPVDAVAPSRWYKWQKFYAKHWKLFASVGTAIALLLVTTTVAAIMTFKMYQAKTKLTDTLAELTQKNEKLLEQENQIRETADFKQLKSAVGMAFSQFREKLFREQTKAINANPELFVEPEMLQAIENGTVGMAIDPDTDPSGVFQVEFMILDMMMSPDAFDELVNLKLRNLVEAELKPVLEYLEDEKRITQLPLAFQEEIGVEFEEANELEGNVDFEFVDPQVDQHIARLKSEAVKRRPQFFKILLERYRNDIQNPVHVAKALNLLAAALLETNATREQAEPYLREALAITQDKDVNLVSRRLIHFIR